MAEGDLQRLFGRNFRARRIAMGLSQEVLADQIGLHRTYIGGIERGDRNPSLKAVERLAEALSTDVFELLRPDEVWVSRKRRARK